MVEEFGLIEYRGFKNIFIGLYKEKEQYYVIYGITEKPDINLINDEITIQSDSKEKLLTFDCNQRSAIIIPFISKNNITYHIISIDKPAEYHHIIEFLETIL